MSNDWAIRAKKLSKVYRLYRKPTYRFLDVFGLCPAGDRYYAEHAALDHIDLGIRAGERVAIIGRNGAGKSTLLKLVASTLQPTSGTIEVRGSVRALLEIWAGFHPDFTGRENVLASLAYQGIIGSRAIEKLEEVVEFAELEEYIDQPLKTYSTGMMMRLMFSAATCVEPDILLADEVLSVGDAYFVHKSLARVKRLVQTRGTTFVLVTHDHQAAVSVCERFIWIDRGRIMLDGTADLAIASYHQ
ncbi:MAG: ABC transporter ATP-binding protein, partial [bacterium]